MSGLPTFDQNPAFKVWTDTFKMPWAQNNAPKPAAPAATDAAKPNQQRLMGAAQVPTIIGDNAPKPVSGSYSSKTLGSG